MRKILTIIIALTLAAFTALLYGAYQKGIPLKELNPERVREIFMDFRQQRLSGGAADPENPQVNIVTLEEENLSYEERLEKGNYFLDRGFLTFAIPEYVKASQLEPKRAQPYLNLAKAYLALRDYEKARVNLETLLFLEPENPEARFRMAQIYIRQNRLAEAETAIQALKSEGRESFELDYEAALIFLMTQRFEEAKQSLEQAQAKSPSPELQEKLEKFLTAFQEFEFAEAAEPLYLNELLARALNQTKDYELALFKLKEILRTRPDLRDAWILLGFSYLNLQEHYFALTAFERAYELDSEWPATQYFLGLTYLELGKSNEAATYFQYALKNQFEPRAAVLSKLADLYLEMNDQQAAVQAYKEILELNQNDINAFVRPMWIYLELLQTPAEALALAKNAARLFPDHPMAYNLLGWAEAENGQDEQAEKDLKKAIELDPTLAAAHFNLGKLYERRQSTPSALASFKTAYELDPNGSIGRQAALRYNELNQTP